ncbi:MAG: hypothetical protein K5639_05930 [Eubacterium sp.]|nr:hypothetical protein [Eubacterium sp.]
MNSKGNNSIRYLNEFFTTPLRIIAVFTVVISAYDVGRGVLLLVDCFKDERVSLLLALLFVLPAFLSFASAFLIAFAAKRIREGIGSDVQVRIALGSLILSAISFMMSQFGTLNLPDEMSSIILSAIVLICFVIVFLYYQGMGNRALAVFAGIMGLACGVYYLIYGATLLKDDINNVLSYDFVSCVTSCMIALLVLIFVLSTAPDNLMEDVTK